MGKTYTVEQIRNYLLSQDSLGDILYYLNEDNIDEANREAVNDWEDIFDDYNHESEEED